MPVDWKLYPTNWPTFRQEILARAHMQCECTGECDLHQPKPFPRRCCELQHKPARWFKGPVRLTIAHLCKCQPLCANPAHVKAMCQRCHLRVDRFDHAARAAATMKNKTPRFHPSVLHSPRR